MRWILLLIIILTIVNGILFFNITEAPQSIQVKPTIPHNYCDGAIEGLEQELNVAFNTIDKYEVLIGTDKTKLIKDISSCSESVRSLSTYLRKTLSDLDTWSVRAEQVRGRFVECMSNLESCNDELSNCM